MAYLSSSAGSRRAGVKFGLNPVDIAWDSRPGAGVLATMLFATVIAICIASVPLAGGRLRMLTDLRFRGSWFLVAALAVQMTIVYVIPGANPTLLSGAHIASYLLGGSFVVINRRIPGLLAIGGGGALNFLVITINGGIMPATHAALSQAGLSESEGQFASSTALAHPKLSFLGDVFAVPASWPVHNVFSVGDICIVVGATVLLHKVCRSQLLPSRPGEFAQLMRNPSFRRLWGAQGISYFGDWMYLLAVMATLSKGGAAPGVFAILLAAQVGPAALTGLLGGALTDRVPRKLLIVCADVGRVAAVGSLLTVTSPSRLHYYLVAVLLGAFGAMAVPSVKASIPNVVPRRNVVAANALMGGTFQIALMLGPIAGGLVAAAHGPGLAFLVNAASFGVSALLVAGVRLPRGGSDKSETTPRKAVAAGIRYSLTTPIVRGLMLVIGLVMVAAAMRSPLEALFVTKVLDNPAEALGLAAGAWGLGMLLGSLAAPRAVRRWPREKLLSAAIALVGGAVIATSMATSMNAVYGLFLIAGFGNALTNICYQSLLQDRTPDRLRGRVIAASEAVLDFSLLVGAVLAGWIGTVLGVRGGFAAAGVIFLVGGAVAALSVGRRAEPVQGDRVASELTFA